MENSRTPWHSLSLEEVISRTGSSVSGITEEEALMRNMDIKLGKFNFRALGRAHTLSEIDGMVKVIADAESDNILGVRIIGAGASEIIHTVSCAMKCGMKSSELGDLIFSHPTMSEGLMEALEDVHGLGIHIPK